MFERELVDSLFLKRWTIVRTLMPQSVAEHTFLVCHYANDIAVFLGLSKTLHLRLLKRALWHDAKDEIFTSDLPGPNKRGLLDAIGPDAKSKWNAKLNTWTHRVFKNLVTREGGLDTDPGTELIDLILKTADWLEAAMRMATETQMGNRCAERHILPNLNGAIETAKRVCQHHYLDGGLVEYEKLVVFLGNAVMEAQHGQSVGPWITKEDETRTYHDPALGDRK